MKCFKCGKNFDYEKYYGICPKCGCYNKKETTEEQHQEMHDRYDGGYRHGPEAGGNVQGNGYAQGGYGPGSGYPQGGGYAQGSGYSQGGGNVQGNGYAQGGYGPGSGYPQGSGYGPGNGYPQGSGNVQGNGYAQGNYGQGSGYPQGGGYGPGGGYPQGSGYGPGNGAPRPAVAVREVHSWRNQKGGGIFLLISIFIFVASIIGGTLFGVNYGEKQEERIKEELLSYEPPLQEHHLGDSFPFQALELTVEEARLLGTEEELGLPEGKKLVAVRLTGCGDGEWNYQNRLPDLYIRTPGDACYEQISSYEYEIYGNVFGMEALDAYALCESGEADGWVAFLLDEEEQRFTLYLEEREGEYLQKIEELHAIELEVSKGDDR